MSNFYQWKISVSDQLRIFAHLHRGIIDMKINLTLVRKTSQQPLISPFCPHIQIWFTWQTWLNFFDTFVHFLDTYSNFKLDHCKLSWVINLWLWVQKDAKMLKRNIFHYCTHCWITLLSTRKPQNVKSLVFVSCAKKILMYNGVAETRFWCIMALQWGVSHDLMATISEIESSILPAPNCVSRVIHQKPKLGMQANTRSIQQTVLWSIPRKTWLQNTWKRRFLQNLDVART